MLRAWGGRRRRRFIKHFGPIRPVATGHRSFTLTEDGPWLSLESYFQGTALKGLRRLTEEQKVGGNERDALLHESSAPEASNLGSIWPGQGPEQPQRQSRLFLAKGQRRRRLRDGHAVGSVLGTLHPWISSGAKRQTGKSPKSWTWDFGFPGLIISVIIYCVLTMSRPHARNFPSNLKIPVTWAMKPRLTGIR